MHPDEDEAKEKGKSENIRESKKKESERKVVLHQSKRSMTSHRLISKKIGKEYLNDELRDQLRSINKDMIKPELIFLIPFNVKKYMIYSLVVNVKALKNKYYSNKFIYSILTKIKFKQVKISELHSNFYSDLTEYLNKFFNWNTEYNMFSEHFKVIRDIFDIIYLDLKKMFYDFILKKKKYVFNKKNFYILMFLLNEIHQFRWSFCQITDQLLTYAAYKGI
jgi:hypothetical protein